MAYLIIVALIGLDFMTVVCIVAIAVGRHLVNEDLWQNKVIQMACAVGAAHHSLLGIMRRVGDDLHVRR